MFMMYLCFTVSHMFRIVLYQASFAGSQQLLQRCGSVRQLAHLGLLGLIFFSNAPVNCLRNSRRQESTSGKVAASYTPPGTLLGLLMFAWYITWNWMELYSMTSVFLIRSISRFWPGRYSPSPDLRERLLPPRPPTSYEKTWESWESSQTRQGLALLALQWIRAMLWEFGERWRRCFRVVGIFALEDAALTDLAESSRRAFSVVYTICTSFQKSIRCYLTIYCEDMILQRGTSSSGMNWSYKLDTLCLCAFVLHFVSKFVLEHPWTFFVIFRWLKCPDVCFFSASWMLRHVETTFLKLVVDDFSVTCEGDLESSTVRSLEFPPLASCLLTVLPTCSFPSFESVSVFAWPYLRICCWIDSRYSHHLRMHWSPLFCSLKDWSRMWCQCMLGWGDWEYLESVFFRFVWNDSLSKLPCLVCM